MRALILEDDAKLVRFLARVLSEEGFVSDECACGVDAIARGQRGAYDLVILDWGVPETDGLSVCRQMRRGGMAAPILMLSARCEPKERALGLSAGADDFVAKPFEVEELVARVRALLRRTTGFGPVRCGALEVDPRMHEAKLGEERLALSPLEHALLLQLALRGGYVVERAELLAHVWGLDFDPNSNLVEVHVGRLREKLGRRAAMIETVRGVGYRLRAQIASRSPADH